MEGQVTNATYIPILPTLPLPLLGGLLVPYDFGPLCGQYNFREGEKRKEKKSLHYIGIYVGMLGVKSVAVL